MARLNIAEASPQGMKALLGIDRAAAESLGELIVTIVKLRASQINGCGYCVDMHATELNRLGYDARKKDALAGWHHADLYDEKEQVALAFTDALTGGIDEIDDATWDRAGEVFGERGRGDLVLAVGAINTWNMVGLAGRMHAH